MAEASTVTEQGTAYHEAGHIVAAYVNGVAFWSVTIEPDGNDLGTAAVANVFLRWERGNGPRRLALDRHLVGLFAGPAAEHIFSGQDLELTGCGGDERAAYDWLSSLPPLRCRQVGDEVFDAHLERMRHRAKSLIQYNWPLVERLAEVLLRLRTMDRDKILAALRGPGVVDTDGRIAPSIS